MKKNEQGFALVLSLVLMLAMSLMGGALIVISAGDHRSNNKSDEYQQTFYVAETALIEGEKYVLNKFLGPWNTSNHKRDTSKRALPAIRGNVDAFIDITLNEFDFRNEADVYRLMKQKINLENVHFPKIYNELVYKDILVMEYIEGISLLKFIYQSSYQES